MHTHNGARDRAREVRQTSSACCTCLCCWGNTVNVENVVLVDRISGVQPLRPRGPGLVNVPYCVFGIGGLENVTF